MMRMLKKIAGWSWKKKIIGIICMMLILVLGMAGADISEGHLNSDDRLRLVCSEMCGS